MFTEEKKASYQVKTNAKINLFIITTILILPSVVFISDL